MKTLLSFLALVGIAAGQSTGDYTFTRKAATGYTPVIITPVTNNVIQWNSSGVPVNLALGSLATLSAAPAGTLSGTVLNSTVVTSSLTSVGIITSGTWRGSLVAGQYGGTGVANTGKTITLGGNLTTTGAFNTTFAQAASITVSLPSTNATMARTDAGQSFTGSQTFDSTTFYVDATNHRLGIGTTSPGVKLAIVDSAFTTNGGVDNVVKLHGSNMGVGQAILFNAQPTGQGLDLSVGRLVGIFDGNSYSTDRVTLQGPNGGNPGDGFSFTLKASKFGFNTTTPVAGIDIGSLVIGNGINTGLSFDTSGNGTFGGDLRMVNQTTKGLIRTVPTTVGNTINVATITSGNFAANVEIWFNINGTGYAQSKRYFMPLYYGGTGGAWQTLVPISSTGAYGSEDADLEVNIASGTATIRIRRTGGSTAGTAQISIMAQGDVPSSLVVTSDSTTATGVSAPTVIYAPTVITQVGGNVGLGVAAPAVKLDVGGAIKAGGVVRLKGYTVSGLSGITAVQGDTAFVTDASSPTYGATVAGGGAVVTRVFYNGTNWVCQ